MSALKICLVASEVTPFAKSGGLADVVSAIARFLDRAGHDVRVVMPMYFSVREGGWDFEPIARLQDLPFRIGDRTFTASVSQARIPKSDAAVWFLRCPELYGREGIYTSDPDEHLRFAMLCRGAIEVCQRMQWGPDIFHCNDWHTGLIPLYLKSRYSWDRLLEGTKTLLTLHNIGYQGVFPAEVLGDLDLEAERHLLYQGDLEKGQFNYLKTGLLYADALSTVSETYAREIQSAELGMGLEELLRTRSDSLFGITNGVDYAEWNPATDEKIPHNYSVDDMRGKAKDKAALLEEFELAAADGVPVIGAVSRLTVQKGFELLPDILPVILQREDLRLIVLGSGEQKYEQYFQWLHDSFPTKVGFYCGYNDELAHWIEAGSDIFLMPSRYEPCGLNQMYSLKYGTVPIVRKTGGLADTVQQFDPATGEGTGFVFEDFSSDALFQAIGRSLDAFQDRSAWKRLVRNGMSVDYSWDRQGLHYVELYERLLSS